MSDEDGPAPTPRYKRTLENSVGVAREMGHSYVGVEHLFLAIIRERDAVPTQALAKLVDLDRVEASLLEEIASYGYAARRRPTPCGSRAASCRRGWPPWPLVPGTDGTWRVTRRGSP